MLKMFFFAYRLYLAALHYNENAERPQATTAVFKGTFPEAKVGENRVREVKTQSTFSMYKMSLVSKFKTNLHINIT